VSYLDHTTARGLPMLWERGDQCEVDPRRSIGLSTNPFLGSPPEPVCQSSRHRTLRTSRWDCRVGSSRGWPCAGNRGSPVAIARGAHRVRIEQCDVRGGRPPSTVAVASADGFYADPAAVANQATADNRPRINAGQCEDIDDFPVDHLYGMNETFSASDGLYHRLASVVHYHVSDPRE